MAMRGYPRNQLTDRSGTDPVATKTAQSRGYTISYEDTGAGPVIVLIPGATMSAADWRDAGYVDQLAPTHRVLSVDPLGNGLSDKPHDPDDYGWPAVANDMLAVMDAADVDRAVVWGYSRGGRLAAVLASEHPDRVAALVLHDASPENVMAGTPPPAHAEALMRGDFGLMWAGFDFSQDDQRYDEEVNDPRALGALWSGQARSGIAINLARIVAPALVIAGDDDRDVAKTVADALNVKLHVLPGLDHLRAFSRLDLVLPLVLGFLEPLGL
jgi:pimeloyl-ACP methyl ester carboxylesterase